MSLSSDSSSSCCAADSDTVRRITKPARYSSACAYTAKLSTDTFITPPATKQNASILYSARSSRLICRSCIIATPREAEPSSSSAAAARAALILLDARCEGATCAREAGGRARQVRGEGMAWGGSRTSRGLSKDDSQSVMHGPEVSAGPHLGLINLLQD